MPGRTLKNISLCLHALCLIVDFIATEKPRRFVQKLWMIGTSCGNARKNWKKLKSAAENLTGARGEFLPAH